MTDFGATDTSTTTLAANQFPVSAVWVPNDRLRPVQGGTATTDSGGKTSAPVAVASAGRDAAGASSTSNPVQVGGLSATALPTAVSTAQVVEAMLDKFGRIVTQPGTIRDLRATQTTTISSSTTETTIFTAVASVFLDVVLMIFTNTSTSATRVDIRDTTSGTVLGSVYVPAGDMRGFAVPGESIPQTAVNTNWTAQCATSVNDLRVYVLADKNK